jgi:hypothetical protein
MAKRAGIRRQQQRGSSVAPDDPAAALERERKRVRSLQAALNKTKARLEEAEVRADIAEDEVLATPYRRWVPIEDGGQGHWLPKGERPEEPGKYFVRIVDMDGFVYTGTVYPNISKTGEDSYDDDCYDVQVYCSWKDRDVRWWSAPTPQPPPVEG